MNPNHRHSREVGTTMTDNMPRLIGRRRLIRAAVAGLLFLASISVGAQEAWYENKPIADITFEGLEFIDEAELRPIVDPYIGELFTNETFLEVQRKLYALDYFRTIIPEAVDPDGTETEVEIRFNVEERPIVDEIRITGNRRIRTDEILDEIVIKVGDLISRSRLELDRQAVVALYRDRGFPEVEVTAETETDEGEERDTNTVVFSITEGAQTTIRRILFSGNSFASAATLRNVIESKEQNIFNPGTFRQANLAQDRILIQRWYQERGYIDAQVVDVAVETETSEEENREFVTLTFFVEEGEQYTYEGIEFEGNSVFSDEQLAERVRQRPGGPFNLIRFQSDFQNVANLYFENGYIDNNIVPREIRDEEENSISFVILIEERPRSHIENIIIEGNERTQDEVILRELPVQVGDIFSAARIRQGIQNLYNLRYFSTVDVETPRGSADGLMDLVITVEEQMTADIRFSVNFGGSTEFPIAGSIGWQDSNFLGGGQTLGVELSVSPVTQSLSFTFQEPWLFGERWSAGVNFTVDRSLRSGIPQDQLFPIFGENDANRVPDPFEGYYVFRSTREYNNTTYQAGDVFPGIPTPAEIAEYDLVTDFVYAGGTSAIPDQYLMGYENWDLSVGLNTGYRIQTPAGFVGLGTGLRSALGYISYDQSIYRPFDSSLRQNLNNWQLVNKWSFNASLDSRDFFLSPSEGYLLRQDLTLAGGFLFGRRHYIRTDSRGEAYFTLVDEPVFEEWNFKLVLAMQSSIALILNQFWVPPEFDGRSLDNLVGPDSLSIDGMFVGRGWDQRSGGLALWNNWLELRMPIVEQLVWFDMFFDAVALYDSVQQIGTLGIDNMLFGFGAGFRFTLPQFPIRLYLAKRFQVVNGQVMWQGGDIFTTENDPSSGLDFVFSIGAGLF